MAAKMSTTAKLFWLSVAVLAVGVIYTANTPTAPEKPVPPLDYSSPAQAPSTEAANQAAQDKVVKDAEQKAQAEADAQRAVNAHAEMAVGATIFGRLKTCLINKAHLYNDKYTLVLDGCGPYLAMWRNFCDGDYADANSTCDDPAYVEAQAAIYIDKAKK
ncbi:MAG: hypothetical protein ACLQHF_11855 [Terracidiphilus sp.]